jgi:hypothetical protein
MPFDLLLDRLLAFIKREKRRAMAITVMLQYFLLNYLFIVASHR